MGLVQNVKQVKWMVKRFTSVLIVIVILFTLSGCKQYVQSDKLKIVTTIFPAYSFTKEIVGDLCDVEVVLKPGQDSHNYDPSVSTVISIRNADMFIYTCEEMEAWATKLISSLNKNTVVMAGKGIKLEIVSEEEHNHVHPEGEHTHDHSYDPHIWTSIRNSIIMVKNIMTAICGLDPDNSEIYMTNGNAYIQRLEEMDRKFTALFEGHEHHELFFVSPFTLYYFIKDYDLHYHSLYKTCSTEVEVSALDLIAFIKLLKEEDVEYIYTKEFISDTISNKIVDQTGVNVRVLHSGHNITYGDYSKNVSYLDILEQNYEILKEGVN